MNKRIGRYAAVWTVAFGLWTGLDNVLAAVQAVPEVESAVQVEKRAASVDGIPEEERAALRFLYDYMPLCDRVDYDSAFYIANVRSAFRARAEMPWGASVPEREFRHFVLPVRVNNEHLDSARQVFYRELKPRVQALSMYEAVLEVNHWCHEKAVYQPTDMRTSAPLATVKTAYGRCGEESVLLVAALRSVGIPARQVYTPRWAHTDDNHAWVEAWVDGRWHFLGACEPEPVLDLAWFNEPASRGMFMHTKVFGDYDGPEEVIARTPCHTEINVIGQYAPTGTLRVRVEDTAGRAVRGARVEFKIYNYAEFYPVAAYVSDSRGEVSLTAGRGDLLVWASFGDRFGFAKASFGRDSLLVLTLNRRIGEAFSVDLDMEPPAATAHPVTVSAAQRSENDRRLQAEDAIRDAYTATFPDAETAWARLASLGDTALRRQAAGLLERSRGNHAVVTDFLAALPAGAAACGVHLLSAVSDKDLRDITPEVLHDHLAGTPPCAASFDSAVWEAYVLNPRVSHERLTPYKRYFQHQLPDSLKMRICDDPAWFAAYCRTHIRLDSVRNPQRVPVSPIGVWRCRTADFPSLQIFYVSVLRSLGIPARVHEVTGKTQYMDVEKRWRDVDFGEAVAMQAVQGLLYLSYAGSSPKDPVYYTHFTLSRYNGLTFDLLTFDESRESTWRRYFENGQAVDTGYYLLCSGSRLAQGGVLAHLEAFGVSAADTAVTVPLVVRQDSGRLGVIGAFDAEQRYRPLAAAVAVSAAKKTAAKTPDVKTPSVKMPAVSAVPAAPVELSILQTVGRGFYVLAVLGPGQEPTDHALRDIGAVKTALEGTGRPFLFLFRHEDDWRRFQAGKWRQLPSRMSYGLDEGGTIEASLRENLDLPTARLPVWIVADSFNRVVWCSQGYTIGLGDQLLKVLQSLDAPSQERAR